MQNTSMTTHEMGHNNNTGMHAETLEQHANPLSQDKNFQYIKRMDDQNNLCFKNESLNNEDLKVFSNVLSISVHVKHAHYQQ